MSSMPLFCALILAATAGSIGDPQDEIEFISHLISQEFWGDAIYTVEQFEDEHADWLNRNPQVSDSLNFWAGWSGYNRRELTYASDRLGSVSKQSPLFEQSRFFRGYMLAHLSVEEQSSELLNSAVASVSSLNPDRELLQELKSFELAGFALLDRDYPAFDEHASDFTKNYHAMAGQQQNFREYAEELRGISGKSPWVAGVMSAAIPGSGKMYAGRRGDGISTFLQVAVFGGVFAESVLNAGWNHPRTWISGAGLGIFYSANIRGSIASVRITQQEVYEQVDQQILLDLHIPLRTIFR